MLVKIFNLINDFLFTNTRTSNTILENNSLKKNSDLSNIKKPNYTVTKKELEIAHDLIEIVHREEKIARLIYKYNMKGNNPLIHTIKLKNNNKYQPNSSQQPAPKISM